MLPLLYPDSDVASQVVQDPQKAPIPPLHKAIFGWVEKFTRRSWEMTAADIQNLRDAGATEKEIVDWAQVACVQTWFVMMADGGGIALETKTEAGPVVGHNRAWYHGVETGLLAAAPGGSSTAGRGNGTERIAWVDMDTSEDAYTKAAAAVQERYGFAPNLLRACSLSPRCVRSHAKGLELLERPRSTALPPRLHALVRGMTSHLNRCVYSSKTVRALAESMGEGDAYDTLARRWDPEAWPDQDRVVLEFAVKATRNTYKITAKDAQAFRDAGLSDEAYVDVLNTVAIQSALDRLANSLGVVSDEIPCLEPLAVAK